jgi:hypothetical protein
MQKLWTALDELLAGPRHVVAQVVEAELVVGAVGDVLGVLGARWPATSPTGCSRSRAEGPVDAAHQLGLVLRQVVVDGDDVDALALKGIEV